MRAIIVLGSAFGAGTSSHEQDSFNVEIDPYLNTHIRGINEFRVMGVLQDNSAMAGDAAHSQRESSFQHGGRRKESS